MILMRDGSVTQIHGVIRAADREDAAPGGGTLLPAWNPQDLRMVTCGSPGFHFGHFLTKSPL